MRDIRSVPDCDHSRFDGATALPAQHYVPDSEPKLFSYDELVQLSLEQEMSPELAEKLRLITTIPFINNEAYFDRVKPQPLVVSRLGPSQRVAFWNIERGLEFAYIELFLTNKDAFMAKVEEERKEAKGNKKRILHCCHLFSPLARAQVPARIQLKSPVH